MAERREKGRDDDMLCFCRDKVQGGGAERKKVRFNNGENFREKKAEGRMRAEELIQKGIFLD